MKTSISGSICAALLAVGLNTGCSKNESSSSTAGDAVDSSRKAVGDAVSGVKDTAVEVKQAAEKAVGDVKQQASDVAAAADTQVKALVEQAKSLIAEKKYPEALTLVKDKLSALKLTAEQQTMVDSLKAQIQKAMASVSGSDASKAASDLLKPK